MMMMKILCIDFSAMSERIIILYIMMYIIIHKPNEYDEKYDTSQSVVQAVQRRSSNYNGGNHCHIFYFLLGL